MAELMRETFLDLGLQVQWQQVEDGRANVLGTRPGAGGGPSLMFNGHMDTSYSGREPWLAHVPGFQPSAFVEDGRLYGLGISNMKGALACYVEALRALSDAGVQLRGDVHDRGRLRRDREDAVRRRAGRRVPRLRGRLALPRVARRRRGHVHPRRADRVEGRARPLRLALAADLDERPVHPHGVQRGKARPELDRPHARRPRRGARVDPELGGRSGERVPRRQGDRERRRGRGRVRLARLADAAPHGSLPRRARAADEGDGHRALAGARDGARSRRALPRARDRRRGVRDGSRAPRSPKTTRWSARSTPRTPRCSARRPSGTSRAGSPTPRFSRATASRR